MKRKIQEQRISRFLRIPAMAMTTALAFVLSANVVHAGPEEIPTAIPAAPEVGSWHIGAGVLALLALAFVRYIVAGRKTQVSN